MSEIYLCRLCINSCKKVYRSLYDENSRPTQIYDIAVKYFEPMFLHVQEVNHQAVLCLDCWGHIVYFHNFRLSVLLAQSKYMRDDKLAVLIGDGFIDLKQDEVVGVKMENDECVPASSIPPPVKCNDNASTEIFYDIIVKEEEVLNSPTSKIFEQELCHKDKEIHKSNFFLTDEEEFISLVKSNPITEANSEPNIHHKKQKATMDNHENAGSNGNNWLNEKYIEKEGESMYISGGVGENISAHDEFESKNQDSSEGNIQANNELKNRSTKRKRVINEDNFINAKTFEEQTNNTSLLIKRDDLASESQPRRTLAQKESDEIIGKLMPNLECGVCKESCGNFTLLHKHFRRHHPNEDIYIVCCERKFDRRNKFQTHIRTHLNPRAFEGKLCDNTLSTSHITNHNVNNDHGILNVSTTYNSLEYKSDCIQTSQRKTIVQLDDIIAQWRPNLECDLCNHSSSSFTLLQEHFKKSHPRELCYVSCCEFMFTSRYQIEKHIRFHNDPNVFK